jgi:hypothetical protein
VIKSVLDAVVESGNRHTAKPSTKTLTAKAPRIWEVLWNSAFMKLIAGANIDDVNGHRKVMADIRAMMNHFLFSAKFRGFNGSS